jgi:hypothetical protein
MYVIRIDTTKSKKKEEFTATSWNSTRGRRGAGSVRKGERKDGVKGNCQRGWGEEEGNMCRAPVSGFLQLVG